MLFASDEYLMNPSTEPANAFYNVLPDGEGFVMLQSGTVTRELILVQNFFKELRQVVRD